MIGEISGPINERDGVGGVGRGRARGPYRPLELPLLGGVCGEPEPALPFSIERGVTAVICMPLGTCGGEAEVGTAEGGRCSSEGLSGAKYPPGPPLVSRRVCEERG